MSPDFDFIVGNWNVRHRRLNSRLTGCTEWTEFSGLSSTCKILVASGTSRTTFCGSRTGGARCGVPLVRPGDRNLVDLVA